MAKYFLLIPPSRYSLQTGSRQPTPSVRDEKDLSEKLREKFEADGWEVKECGKDGKTTEGAEEEKGSKKTEKKGIGIFGKGKGK